MTGLRFIDHFLGPDTHTNRPAASAVNKGAKYVCTTHQIIYSSDQTSWTTWATLGGTYTDEQARDAIGAALVAGTGMTITVDDAGDTITLASSGGGGGGGWDHPINALPLSTLTGWTAGGAGTWGITSSVIRQSVAAAAPGRLRYTAAPIPQSDVVIELDIKVDTMNQGTNSRAGLLVGYPPGSDSANSVLVCLRGNAGNTAITHVYFENEAAVAGPALALGSSISTGVWTTFRIHKVGGDITVYAGGVLVGTGHIDQTSNMDASTFALYSYGTDASFRNLDVWTPTLP